MFANSRDSKWRKNVEGDLDEMLRNPRHAFRKLRTLARVFGDDSPNLAVTKTILRSMGARRSLGEADVWIKEDNWVKGDDGRVHRNAKGMYVLKKDIRPGQK
jgi:hypothetical protein